MPDTGPRPTRPHGRYRPDIDGLRAVAILPVVTYHLRLPLVTGGFVGVDVFFVISGFLVGSIILREIGAGAFTFADFYRRRIARIFPAFLAVALVTLCLAWRFLPPADYRDLSWSTLAAIASASNVYFWRKTSYFDPALDGAPLLHTWSLGVEEQFYIVAPVLLLLVTRLRPGALKGTVLVLSGLSFLLCVAFTRRAPEAAFYLLPFRFWELGLGIVVALRLVPTPSRAGIRAAEGLAGLALVAASVFAYTSATPFPGVAALAPCLGAALVIHAGLDGPPALPNRLLGWGPIRFVGLVSYSLYLWHWPLIVLQNSDAILFADSDKLRSKLGLFAIAVAIATLSWLLVERPARRAGRGRPASVIVPWAAAAGGVAALCAAIIASGGFVTRYPPEAARLAAYPTDDFGHFRRKRCFITQEDALADFDAAACLATSPDKPNYLLLGDSHAAHLWQGLSTVLTGINVEEAAVAGCPPTIVDPGLSKLFCRDVMDEVYAAILKGPAPAKLILAARWRPGDVQPLTETLRRLRDRGVTTILIGPIVQYGYPLPRLLADAIRFGDPDRPSRFRDREAETLDARLRDVARGAGVEYVSLQSLLCGEDRCATLDDRQAPLQFDTGHLTAGGSTFVVRRMVEAGLLP